ncbi:HAMP domain-containing histidine kinase [Allokutzneria sp. A3M-2-11 16]|uniref:sensor histidine kinase n=1 Tax=Allokutzneria sp. A3M-2-11 16 TaxID=2962043 RepID=UPI0020B64852|nr:HAMP domain-containing sensor histidine kinase [Allokutzneria sp. A3M-2-11 16]MCP3802711.1 HAMP domain-containing histidine kinase [Allokutzneria sp. A3M-2-11 16]
MKHRPWTLRTRLVATLVALCATGLTVVGALSLVWLDLSLVSRIDAQLQTTSGRMRDGQGPPLGKFNRGDQQLPTDLRLVAFSRSGVETYRGGSSLESPSMPRLRYDVLKTRVGTTFTVPDSDGGSDWRVRVVIGDFGRVVAVAMWLRSRDETVAELMSVEVVVGLVILVGLAVLSTYLVRIGLRPLTRIEGTAEAIAAGQIDRRVPDADPRTETGRLGQSLNVMLGRISSALREREHSEQRLRQFVADASHELRTPLTSIRGFAELYRRGGAPEKSDVDRLMARIEDESQRMGGLVEDLLLLARLDEQRALDLTEVDLLVPVNDVVHDARVRDQDRSITLSVPDGPVRVIADEARLRQVVTNLVINAIAHTPPGSPVRVTVRYRPVEEPARTVAWSGSDLPVAAAYALVEVADNGAGIDAEHAQRVFDRFYRADAARTRARGGSGLGLAISAAIVSAHNGRIELDTEPGRGTTTRIVLPPA